MELHYQSTSHESAELTAFNENLELNLGWPLWRTGALIRQHDPIPRFAFMKVLEGGIVKKKPIFAEVSDG